MDIRKIKKLIELLEESNIGELEIREGEETVRISRNGVMPMMAAPMAYAAPAPAPAATPAPAAAEVPAAKPVLSGHIVRSPMVGTFYRAPMPGEPPFVEIGQAVEPGTVLCIIEVMKLMNSIEAGVRGTVREIFVANATAVDAGEVLMAIEPRP